MCITQLQWGRAGHSTTVFGVRIEYEDVKRHREVPNASVSVNSSVGNLDVLLSTILGVLHA